MEKENTAQPKAAANGAEARGNVSAAVGLGKFKSVDALLNAYNSLEAEFTRRSQLLRELEERERAAARAETGGEGGERSGSTSAAPAGSGESAGAGQAPRRAEELSGRELAERVRQIAEEYFAERENAERESAPYIMAEGGSFSAAPAPRVRSLEEAGRLAADLFRKNG